MVKVAIAGGTGNVASEIVHGILAEKKHDVTILTRKNVTDPRPDLEYITVDYTDEVSLAEALYGIDTVLSFLLLHQLEGNTAQKNLIHACIEAGVKRFAPSEWGIKNDSGVSSYKSKDETAAYLAELNKETKVLEYCLFQPSIFLDYFAHPYPLSKDLITWPFFIDYQNRRAMVLDSGDQPMVLTAISDDVAIVARALDYPNPWPTIGGIRGTRTTINELIALGKEIRGGDWQIEHVKSEDVEKGVYTASWVPKFSHPAIPVEQRAQFSKDFVLMFMTAIMNGAWDVSDEWNRIFPDYKFMGAEEYLRKAWAGKA